MILVIRERVHSLLGDARASVRRWRLARWEVSGYERFSGLPVSLTYFGHDFGFRTILHKVFAPGYSATMTGRAWLGAPGLPLTPTDRASDIVAIELEYAQWRARDTGAGFHIPIWTRTEIMVADAYQQMKKSSSLKDDLRRVRKNKIICEISRDVADLRVFYEGIYVPYILARHGNMSVPDGWDTLLRTAQGGELILAKDANGKILGGMLLGRNSKKIYARAVGLIGNEKTVLKTGVGSALYQACFERAAAHGYDRLGMGLTAPFLTDGILQFKKKWGLRLLNEHEQGIWLQFNHATAAVGSFLINNPFIYRDAGKIHGAVFTEDPQALGSESLRRLHAAYYLPGMESLHVCSIKAGSGESQSPVDTANTLVFGASRNLYTGAN